MFVTVNRRIQGKAQMRDRDPVLAYLPDEDEPFDWLVGMFHFQAEQLENDGLRMARASSSEEAALSKQARKLLDYDEYSSSEEGCEDDEEPPKRSIIKKASSSASCSKRAKRPRSIDECEGSDGNISH